MGFNPFISIMNSYLKKIQSTKVRDFSLFFNFSSFTKPDDGAIAQERVKRNLTYFRGNYGIINLVALILAGYFHPSLIYTFVTSIAILVGLFSVNELKVGEKVLTKQEKFLIVLVSFVLFLWYSENISTLIYCE